MPLEPIEVNAYYRVPVGADAAQVTPPPNGLEMIAGSASATEAQDTAIVSWACGSSTDRSPVPLECSAGAEQRLQLVGAERLQRRDAGDQHGGNGDHAAAAGDRIDEAGNEGGSKQEGEQVEGEILHGRDSGRELS